jgi:hypothetical protein
MDSPNVIVRRASLEALIHLLKQFSTEKNEQAATLYAKGGHCNECMANWYEGTGGAYGLTATWLERDVLNAPSA